MEKNMKKSVYMCVCVLSHSVVSDSLPTPWTVARQAPVWGDSPGKNTGVGCHFLLHECIAKDYQFQLRMVL